MRRCRATNNSMATLAVILCVGLLVGCQPDEPTTSSSQLIQPAVPVSAGTYYQAVLESTEDNLASLRLRLDASAEQNDAAPARALFEGWMLHARLTGEIQSYLQAREALAVLTERLGTRLPCVEQAQFDLAIHRPAAASVALDKCGMNSSSGMRADIAFYQGFYSQALVLASRALTAYPTADNYTRLARFRMATGSPQEAAALMEVAERRYYNNSAHQRAWFKVQRGLIALHSGDFERARALYLAAQNELPGWWFAEEHLAEVHVLLGDIDEAFSLYDSVIEKNGFPEFLESRAKLSQDSNKAAAAADIKLARERFESRLELLPEASTGHVLAFFLEHGPLEKGLAMAQTDYAQRPYGDSAMLLAQAQILNGEPANAVRTLEAHLAAGWNTAEAHHILARAFEMQGKGEAVAEHQAEALRLNARITDLDGPF